MGPSETYHGCFWGWWIFPLIMIGLCIFFSRSRRWRYPSNRYGYSCFPYGRDNRESAEEILKRRYAAGEISRDEFNTMMEAL